MTTDNYIHLAELVALILGAVLPSVYNTIRLRSIFRDFPPHRHVNGRILYPKGYAPERQQDWYEAGGH